MAEYDIAFGERLAETARMVADEGLAELDAQRTVLYLSLLSTEIALKAMLERAGKPVPEIRARSHRLAELLSDLGRQCEVEIEIAPGTRRYVAASRIRGIPLSYGEAQSTVGSVIDAESQGASTYPNQVRYGAILRHFPAEVVVQMAAEVSTFARHHWNNIRVK
jgi:hypothetical protein